ncbi:Hsp70 family protein [Dactylosporangium cerinum]
MLTHPAVWSRPRLAVLVDAARRAGFGDVGLVAEPVAAAAYFLTVLGREIPAGKSLVVYDLGAGTFDVSVVRQNLDGVVEVVATNGLNDVGGLDLDAVVVAHARTLTADAAAWGRLDWPQSAADRQARQTLWRGARAVKEQLSRHPAARLLVPLVDVELHLTREEFERAAHPHLDRTVQLTLRTLREAGLPPEAIAGVFLVGGASRVPLAGTLLHRTLGIAPTVIDQPELVVAAGSLLSRPTPAPAVHPPSAPVSPQPSEPISAVPVAPVSPAPPMPAVAPVSAVPVAPVSPPPSMPAAPPVSAVPPEPEPGPGPEPSPEPGPEPGPVAAAGPDLEDGEAPTRRPVSRRALLLAGIAAPVAVAGAGTAIWRPWEPRTLAQVRGATFVTQLTGHTGTVSFLEFLAEESGVLFSSGQDGSVRFWNTADHSQIGNPLNSHTGSIRGTN